MSEALRMIRDKRRKAIATMEEPVIRFDLEQINQVLELIDDLERDKKTLMTDLAVINIQLGSRK